MNIKETQTPFNNKGDIMQNPRKALLVTAGLIILHSAPGWSETGLLSRHNKKPKMKSLN